MTSMSGSTPWPSANHSPFGPYMRKVGHGHVAAVHEGRGAADADETAPGARADERTDPGLLEVRGEGIAAGTAPAVDQHHLRPAVRDRRPLPALAVAHGPVRQDRAVQQLDEAVGDLAAAVPALVDDQPVLLPLPHELPHELVLRVDAGALHVDVADAAAGRLVDRLASLFDPRAIAQLDLAGQRLRQHLPRPLRRPACRSRSAARSCCPGPGRRPTGPSWCRAARR